MNTKSSQFIGNPQVFFHIDWQYVSTGWLKNAVLLAQPQTHE